MKARSRYRYRSYCVCCALPSKLIRHMAELAPAEERPELLAQIEHSATLRQQRALGVRAVHGAARALPGLSGPAKRLRRELPPPTLPTSHYGQTS